MMKRSNSIENSLERAVEKQPTEINVAKKAFFLNLKELTNQHIVERWIATGLIKDGESAKDVAKKLAKYNSKLGEFMENVVEQNTSRKRGGTKKNAYMTGKHPYTGEMIKNPNEYLKIMSDYIINQVNSWDQKEWHQEWTEIVKTLFGIKQETGRALMEVLSRKNDYYPINQ